MSSAAFELLLGARRENGDELVFNIPPMICKLIHPRVFYLKKALYSGGSDVHLMNERFQSL
jgi:hypothetical protein